MTMKFYPLLVFVSACLLHSTHALCTRGPAPIITALNQTCVRFTGANTLDHCSPAGPTGATGAVGATGATGNMKERKKERVQVCVVVCV